MKVKLLKELRHRYFKQYVISYGKDHSFRVTHKLNSWVDYSFSTYEGALKYCISECRHKILGYIRQHRKYRRIYEYPW